MTRVLFLVALMVAASVSHKVSPLSPEVDFHEAIALMFYPGLSKSGHGATLGGLNAYRRAVGISVKALLAGMKNQFDVSIASSLFQEVQVSSAQV